MECKETATEVIFKLSADWNISRMECKDRTAHHCTRHRAIGIYPEWNVKMTILSTKGTGSQNWNISRMECKDLHKFYFYSPFFHWNISRMECKGRIRIWFINTEVYWNISRMECKDEKKVRELTDENNWNISRMECKGRIRQI